jgi:hypothetical protein
MCLQLLGCSSHGPSLEARKKSGVSIAVPGTVVHETVIVAAQTTWVLLKIRGQAGSVGRTGRRATRRVDRPSSWGRIRGRSSWCRRQGGPSLSAGAHCEIIHSLALASLISGRSACRCRRRCRSRGAPSGGCGRR